MDISTAPASSRKRRARWLERLLFLIGIFSIAYYSYVQVEAFLYQRFEDAELEKVLNSRIERAAEPAKPLFTRLQIGTPVGRVEIPRLGVSAIVLAGSDAGTLRHSVGHIPGTALPGAPGNVGLAGHRDTFFRRLKDVRPDDEVRITTEEGVFTYRVENTRVVKPTDVWVLDPTTDSTLTLVTCYPFTYIGSAPQRFIVRASLAH